MTDRNYNILKAIILFFQYFKCNKCSKPLTEVNTKDNTFYELAHKEDRLRYTDKWNCEVLCSPCHIETDPHRSNWYSGMPKEEKKIEEIIAEEFTPEQLEKIELQIRKEIGQSCKVAFNNIKCRSGMYS